MITVQITLSEALASEAAHAGLLEPEQIERILREQLRTARLARLSGMKARLAADPLPPMTTAEVQAEIDAYRAERRHASDA
jgi:hypothetical protein